MLTVRKQNIWQSHVLKKALSWANNTNFYEFALIPCLKHFLTFFLTYWLILLRWPLFTTPLGHTVSKILNLRRFEIVFIFSNFYTKYREVCSFVHILPLPAEVLSIIIMINDAFRPTLTKALFIILIWLPSNVYKSLKVQLIID